MARGTNTKDSYKERKKKMKVGPSPKEQNRSVGQKGKGTGKTSRAPKKAKVMAPYFANID